MIRRFARKARSAAVSALGRAGFLAECERYLQDRRTRSCHENAQAQGSLIAAPSSGKAVNPSGVMVLFEVTSLRLILVSGDGSSPMYGAECAG